MSYLLNILLKLFLSALVGTLIGFERENKRRPAGLRTHILVCLGATLVQIISIDIFNQYRYTAAVDPTRLGAQIISGIGFLGAGTIIHEGISVKGLTTAATLWVVASIGLAIGSGSYIPAILSTILVYATLTMVKWIEKRVSKKDKCLNTEIQIENKPGQIEEISRIFDEMNVNIKRIEFAEYKGNLLRVYLSLIIPANLGKKDIIIRLLSTEGICSFKEL